MEPQASSQHLLSAYCVLLPSYCPGYAVQPPYAGKKSQTPNRGRVPVLSTCEEEMGVTDGWAALGMLAPHVPQLLRGRLRLRPPPSTQALIQLYCSGSSIDFKALSFNYFSSITENSESFLEALCLKMGKRKAILAVKH